MSRKKRSTRSQSPPVDGQGLIYSEYEITAEPIVDRRYRKLPRNVKDEFEKLHGLVTTNPRQAIDELPQWIKRYPDIPLLYNYLSAAYAQAGADREAEQAILENLQRNPDYLFARLNYAELCLGRGDYQAVAQTLDNKFDLKFLYPNRKRFHISEVVGFMSIVGRYFAGIGERESAEKIYKVLHQLAPGEPATRQLHSALHPNALQQVAQRLLKGLLGAQRK